jgi:RNA polymerase sigma-70 factor (ECF subfamily)
MRSDAELMAGIVDKDREAFGLFYDRHASVLFSLCVRILRDGRDAEDALQEIFLQIWREAHRFDASRASARTWLFTLARSRALDRYRSRRSRDQHTTAQTPEMESVGSGDSEGDSVRRQHVRQQLAKLSEAERQVITLSYYDGYTQEEIANRLEEPLGTVKSRVRSGLKKLQRLMSEPARALERVDA